MRLQYCTEYDQQLQELRLGFFKKKKNYGWGEERMNSLQGITKVGTTNES
jgi:hypothetical protein